MFEFERICKQWSCRFSGFNTTKSDLLYIYFSEFHQLFRNNYFNERILMAASVIYFFNLFPLSCKRISKPVDLLRKFQNVSLTISKFFIRPHLDHCDIIHDQAYNFAFHQKLESFQYNASLAITATISGNSREKLKNLALNHFN